jgi:peptidoglycan biosynthesis protein MviN/MurJ (putative lipid II flippase)
MSILHDVAAKVRAHKWLVAILIGAGAAADHFFGSAVLSGLVADLLAAGAPVVP